MDKICYMNKVCHKTTFFAQSRGCTVVHLSAILWTSWVATVWPVLIVAAALMHEAAADAASAEPAGPIF